MPPRRPAHKAAHSPCPYGQTSWSECDVAASHRWGMCKALVDHKSGPRECSNWAVSEDGWCGQHYASKIENEKRAERIAIARAEIDERLSSYMEWVKDHPSVWDSRLVKPVSKGRPFRLAELG